MISLTPLGDPDAVACEGGVCALPGSTASSAASTPNIVQLPPETEPGGTPDRDPSAQPDEGVDSAT